MHADAFSCSPVSSSANPIVTNSHYLTHPRYDSIQASAFVEDFYMKTISNQQLFEYLSQYVLVFDVFNIHNLLCPIVLYVQSIDHYKDQQKCLLLLKLVLSAWEMFSVSNNLNKIIVDSTFSLRVAGLNSNLLEYYREPHSITRCITVRCSKYSHISVFSTTDVHIIKTNASR